MARQIDVAPSEAAHTVGLERIGEDDPDEGAFLRGPWRDGDDRRGFVLEALEGGVEVRAGRP